MSLRCCVDTAIGAVFAVSRSWIMQPKPRVNFLSTFQWEEAQ